MTDEASPLLAGIAADLLDQGRTLHQMSIAFALGTVVFLFFAGSVVPDPWAMASLTAALLLALIQTVLAVRVGFDAALFRRLAGTADLAAFDSAMMAAGLMPEWKAGRALAARVRGASRLLYLQGLALAVQFAIPALVAVGLLL